MVLEVEKQTLHSHHKAITIRTDNMNEEMVSLSFSILTPVCVIAII